MNKHLPLAALLLASSAAASAQSSVTLFGIVDLGLRHVSNEGVGALNSMASGGNATSRFGLRASEDLGGGLSAGHARALLSFPQGEAMLEAARLVLKKGLSVRETEKLAAACARGNGKKAKARRDSYYDEVELALSGALGRKIRVVENRTRQSGKIEMPFFNREDLMKLASALKVLED